jgi:hypothetical protein
MELLDILEICFITIVLIYLPILSYECC